MASYLSTSDSFLKYCRDERRLSAHTIRAYRLDLIRFWEFVGPRFPLLELEGVSKDHLRAYQQTLTYLKARSVSRRMAALRSFFVYAESEKLVAYSPFDGLRLRIRTGRSLPRALGQKTIECLFRTLYRRPVTSPQAKMKKLQDIVLMELLFGAGLRVGELTNLDVERIDLESRSVRVNGKGSRERIIPIVSAELLGALTDYARTCHHSGADGRCFLIGRNRRSPLSADAIRRAVHRMAKAAGVGRVTPHMFRHTFATLLLDRGVDLRVIQRLLGHSSIVTTTIYAQVSEYSQRKVMLSANPRQLIKSGRLQVA